MTLRRQAFAGVRWTTFSSLGRAALQVIQVAILARLLAPGDFGLIAVVVAIMSFLQIFADAGISNAIIHYQEVTREQLSSLFWLNVSTSFALALVLISFSPWVADWYHEAALQSLLMIAALNMVVGSLGQQIGVNAQKELRFAEMAKLQLIAAVCGLASAVVLAWRGAGVYSLACSSLFATTVGCVLSWLLLAQGWRPQLRLRLSEIRPFLKFGGYMVGNNLANTFNSQIDVLLGTRLLGVHAIGEYNVPKNLSLNVQMVINPIITQVGLPIMAKAQQNDALLKRIYMQTVRMTASVNFFIYVTIALFAPEIVQLLLGGKWQSAAPLLQVFACWGLLRSILNPVGSLLYARGKAALAFKWNLALLLFIGPIIWVGSQFGALGMASAMTGLMAALYVPAWYFLIRPSCGATLREYSAQLAVPLALSLAAGLVGYFSASFLVMSFARIPAGLIAGGVSYILLSYVFNREWYDAMLELLRIRYKQC